MHGRHAECFAGVRRDFTSRTRGVTRIDWFPIQSDCFHASRVSCYYYAAIAFFDPQHHTVAPDLAATDHDAGIGERSHGLLPCARATRPVARGSPPREAQDAVLDRCHSAHLGGVGLIKRPRSLTAAVSSSPSQRRCRAASLRRQRAGRVSLPPSCEHL